MWIKTSFAHGCFSTMCSDTVTRHADGWAEVGGVGIEGAKVVKGSWSQNWLKAAIQSKQVDWPCPLLTLASI